MKKTNSNIYIQLVDKIINCNDCALATVVSTTGSTPQKPGSSAIIGKEGLVAGTVGGGSVELRISKKAVQSIDTNESGYFKFTLNDDISEENSSICGGSMEILVDANPQKHQKVLQELTDSFNRHIPGLLITSAVETKDNLEVKREWVTKENLGSLVKNHENQLIDIARKMLANPKPYEIKEVKSVARQTVFLECVAPQPQLIIAGGGRVGKALSHQGKLLGFEVTVWDDRPEYANPENLPDADFILTGQLDEIFSQFKIHRQSYIVLVTRGHKKDADVLRKVIGSDAGYIGMIGSKKKIIQVREQFLKNGWATPQQWEALHAPIGLDINSQTVEEIAVSIAAELVLVRHKLNVVNG